MVVVYFVITIIVVLLLFMLCPFSLIMYLIACYPIVLQLLLSRDF